jgi:hypothetical protein
MELGGSLYIESVDLGANHNGTTFFDNLGIEYIDDGGEQEAFTLKGGSHPISSDLKLNYLGGYSPHYSLDRLAADGSDKLFGSENGFGRMFIYETTAYKAISSSILLGAIKTEDSLNKKAYLVSEMVNCFLGYNPVTSLQENISAILNTGNYPNPFNVNTTIQYTLNEAGPVVIDIYNINGQVVRHLVSEEKLPGEYSIVWETTNDVGGLVNDGFYFYTISVNGHRFTEKMILLR